MADVVAIQEEIAGIERQITDAQAKLKDAKARLLKAQDAAFVDPGANMTEEDKMALIKVNLAEVLNPEIMDEALKRQGHLKVYWGTATTGRPHCGYVRAVASGLTHLRLHLSNALVNSSYPFSR